MSTEELSGTNNSAEVQGRIESGNKNNQDLENFGETKEAKFWNEHAFIKAE